MVFAPVLQKYWDKIVIEDPNWRPHPEFRVEGGFDHGKVNPTALLRAYIDFDGTIIYAGEYYQPGEEISQHAITIPEMFDFERMQTIYADPSIFHRNLQQSQRPGHPAERAKSVYDLYYERGIKSLCSFHGDLSDVSFAHRLLLSWADPENPGVKIVCPRGLYAEKPIPGLHQWGCPNLLWELMNTRRVKRTAQELLHRNQSEAIVDKDNHARDAMKYNLMSYPQASEKSYERRAEENLKADIEQYGLTVAMLRRIKTREQEQEQHQAAEPILYSGNIRHALREFVRRNQR